MVTLATSKGSQADATEIVIPCPDMPTACDTLARWAMLANLKPRKPVFRALSISGNLSDERLTGHSVARIIKGSVATHYRAKGKVSNGGQYVGLGSLNARGVATTAGENDASVLPGKERMRHRTLDTTVGDLPPLNALVRD